MDIDGRPDPFAARRVTVSLYRDVATQMQRPLKLTLSPKGCLINRVPDWETRFVELPGTAMKTKTDRSSAAPSGSGSKTEGGPRRSKRLKGDNIEELEEAKEEEDDNPFLVLREMSAQRSKAQTEAFAAAYERGAEILPNGKFQKWVGIVKKDFSSFDTRKVTQQRLEKEALQAIGELYEEWKEGLAKKKQVKRGEKEADHHDALCIKKIWPLPVHDSFMADHLVSEEVRRRLIAEAEALEGVRNPITWHPNTNNSVFNILHPSLYPLMNHEERKTPVLREPFEPVSPEEVEKIPKGQRDYSFLFHLPREESEMMEQKAIASRMKMHTVSLDDQYFTDLEFQWIPSNVWVDAEGGAHFLSYINGLNPLVNGELYQLLEEVLTEMIPMFEACMNSSGRRKGCDIDFCLRSKQIQVYPRMSSVLLSPNKPIFRGGRKHAEGFDNEKILAIGAYYYSIENVTRSELTVHYTTGRLITKGPRPLRYRRDYQYHDMRETSINCAQGRCVVLPNCEHNMNSFQLEDDTRDGRRRSLVFFLVDPAANVLSTADVPVQQKEWVTSFLESEIFPQLPPLTVDRIAHFTGYGLLSQKNAMAWQEKMDVHRTTMAKSKIVGNFTQFARRTARD